MIDRKRLIADVLEREGGFVDHPGDKGGATKFGITAAKYGEYLGRQATVDEVRAMPRVLAEEIYDKMYFKDCRIGDLPEAIQPVCFDICVNSGFGGMGRILQRALNGAGYDLGRPDGVVGPRTLAAARQAAAVLGDRLVEAIVAQRDNWYRDIVLADEHTIAACKALGLTLDARLLDRMLDPASGKRLVRSICDQDPKAQAAFIRGWIARSDSFRMSDRAMV